MKESGQSQEEVHEGTEALQKVADDVERERAERGRTDFDAPDIPEEQAMADAAAHSEDNPDVEAESREDHVPGAEGTKGRAERGADNILREVPPSRGVN